MVVNVVCGQRRRHGQRRRVTVEVIKAVVVDLVVVKGAQTDPHRVQL